jgi:hypothetical protein
MDVVNAQEKDENRRERILSNLSTLLAGSPLESLEPKSRDSFSSKFNTFKSFINELNA